MDNKQTRFELVSNAYTTMKKGERDIYILDTNKIKDMAMQNAILNIQQGLEVSFELSYEIMAKACQCIGELTLKELETGEASEMAAETCTVYTYQRLQYLDGNNQAEITDIVKGYDTDIEKACAEWYEQQVTTAIEALKAYILN